MKNREKFFNGKVNRLIYLLFTAFLFQGCLDDDETDFERRVRLDDEAIIAYLEGNNIDATKAPDGYYYIKTKENRSGRAVRDESVMSIYYTMSLLNGNKVHEVMAEEDEAVKIGFDQRRITMAPSGLYLGLSTMREGETCRLFIPSYLAYGSYAYKQLIPTNAIFIMDVELADVGNLDEQEELEIETIKKHLDDQTVAEDMDQLKSGLFFKQISTGEGAKPRTGDRLKVHYKGTYLDGEVFDQTRTNKPFEFTLGSTPMIAGFEEGVRLMREGEKAKFIMPSKLAYGESFQVVPALIKEDLVDKDMIRDSVHPFSPLIFEVELVDVN